MDRRSSQNKDRPVMIGLLTNDMTDPNGNSLWRGVSSLLSEQGCGLVCFSGGSPGNTMDDDRERAVLFDLVDTGLLDGLLIWTGAITAFLNPQQEAEFFQKFAPLPIVSIAVQVEGVCSLVLDNYQGMRDMIDHLITVHRRRRIVFLKGPEEHQESNIRFQAYRDTLASHGLPFDPALVLPGLFEPEQGELAVRSLLAKAIDFDAIVTNDDSVAVTAMQALQAHQFELPAQVSVVGFDDQSIAQSSDIPLTTVHIPNFELGRYSAGLLLKMIRGESVDLTHRFQLRLQVRQSCGCTSLAVQEASLTSFQPFQEPFPAALLSRRADILSRLRLTAGAIPGSEAGLASLLDAFISNLLTDPPGRPLFLDRLEQFTRDWASLQKEVHDLQGLINTLRSQVLPALSDNSQAAAVAENLWQQARVLIAECAHQITLRRQIFYERNMFTMHTVNQALITVQNMNQLAAAISSYLPLLGFESVYLSLYENPDDPRSGSRLRVALENGRVIPLDEEGLQFRPSLLAPGAVFKRLEPKGWMVMPLNFHAKKIGFLLLNAAQQEGIIYEAIALQVTSALEGVALQQELLDLSLTDSLTGVGNRRSFEIFLNKEVARNRRYHKGLSLVMLDIDYFKEYNDSFGHPAGDMALVETARMITSCVRRGLDTVARLGGDEFVILLTETNLQASLALAECIRRKIEDCPDLLRKMTASLGVAYISYEDLSAQALFERCDEALYRSKRAGRNRVSTLGGSGRLPQNVS